MTRRLCILVAFGFAGILGVAVAFLGPDSGFSVVDAAFLAIALTAIGLTISELASAITRSAERGTSERLEPQQAASKISGTRDESLGANKQRVDQS